MVLTRFSPRIAMAAILVLAALARLALMAPAARQAPHDPDNYLVLARALAEGKGYVVHGRPTAYRPPLYPILLAPIVATAGRNPTTAILGLNLALGLGTVAVTALAARRWGLSGRGMLLAAAVVALDPVLVAQGRSVMTETLAAFLLATTFAALPGRGGAILGGVGFGLLSLCRPSLLPACGLCAIGAMVAVPGDLRQRSRRAFALVAATVATLAPWAIRNAIALGEPVWTTTHGGYTLALANNPVYYKEVLDGPPGAVWSGPNQRRWWAEVPGATLDLTEPQADRALARRGWAMLRERPRDFARASAARLGRFWGITPTGTVYGGPSRIATALWTVPLWGLLALGLSRRESWRWPTLAAPASVLALTAVHAFYWTDLRMRAPIVPAIALIAAAGVAGRPGSRPIEEAPCAPTSG